MPNLTATPELPVEHTYRVRLRPILKKIALTTGIIMTTPLWILIRVEYLVSGRSGLFRSFGELLSLAPGLVGSILRCGFYRMCIESIFADCRIGFGTFFSHPEVRLGHNVSIGSRCSVGKIVIEDNVLIGSNVDFLSGRYQHYFEDDAKPIALQGGQFQQIRIGHNSWIGNSAIVMADIGDNCIIGAGSVVVKPIPAYSVAVGNPAVVKHQRVRINHVSFPIE